MTIAANYHISIVNVIRRIWSILVLSLLCQNAALAQNSSFAQSIAASASKHKALAQFYRENAYQSLWTDRVGLDARRRKALFVAIENAGDHGLPVFDLKSLKKRLKTSKSPRDRGKLEVEMSRLFLQYARSISTGALDPKRLYEGNFRRKPQINELQILHQFSVSSPSRFLKSLAPRNPEYSRLMKAKIRLEKVIKSGGWGATVSAKTLRPGDKGNAVIALRNRLIRMGYIKRSATPVYDKAMRDAVKIFQSDHGLSADGVAGPTTVGELNQPPEKRLTSVLVAMERERWMNFQRGERHVWVNLTDFSAKIMDNGRVTFESRSVIGKNDSETRSPEFSDTMEHLIVNPTWNVPRSIATKEYLPKLQNDPFAVSHLTLFDGQGREVNRGSVDFNAYTATSFPFDIKEKPSKRNALGLVKFMFPNRHNIYLHDTPAKSLFARESRAFSHGCIRLADPFGFAYALLAKQSSNPKGRFHDALDSRRETQINLAQHVPVHLVYRTAVAPVRGRMNYRRDVYGRDRQVWRALERAGVALPRIAG